jgi:SAM-dependent methyltransferase
MTLRMNLDFPQESAVACGWLELSGWACGAQRIAKIEAEIEGSREQTLCLYGQPRPDVGASFPTLVSSSASGFVGYLSLGGIAGVQVLKVVVTDCEGGRVEQRRSLSVTPHLPHADLVSFCPVCRAPGVPFLPRVERGPFALQRCPSCFLGFVVPQPGVDALKRYYDERYWQNSPAACSPDTEHADTTRIEKLLKAHSVPSARILEMGCGPGYLMNGLRRRGYSVEGQDYSSTAAAFAKEKFGVDVSVGPLHEAPLGPFDAVILRHVIEHSPEPARDLAAIGTRLRPNGVAIIVTPNLDSVGLRALGPAWEWFVPPAHLHYFSAAFFEEVAGQFGFACETLVTRRGDAAPVYPSCRANLDLAPPVLPAPIARTAAHYCQSVEGRVVDADEWEGVFGVASELTVVLRRLV